MVLADSSVWIDHLRQANPILIQLVAQENLRMHPFVRGELSLGNFRNRPCMLAEFLRLPEAKAQRIDEVLDFVEAHRLYGTGLSFVDAHLLAYSYVKPGIMLWTNDKKMRLACERFGRSYAQ